MKRASLAIGLAAAAAFLVGNTTRSAVVAAEEHDAVRPYLALGDSVAFGYITNAGFEYINPENFVAYADYVSNALDLHVTNASCPGETTASFLSAAGADNGCRAFRAQFPLHVSYSGTQMQFARAFLRAHRSTRLVTLTIGANDLFLLEASCGGDLNCVASQLPAALGSIGLNVQTIVAGLRTTGYDGPIVIANYYATDYTDVQRTAITRALDDTLKAAAVAEGATIADDFASFAAVAANPFAAGQTCRAGLLNALPANQFLCDVHPSQSGDRLIAHTIGASLGRIFRLFAN